MNMGFGNLDAEVVFPTPSVPINMIEEGDFTLPVFISRILLVIYSPRDLIVLVNGYCVTRKGVGSMSKESTRRAMEKYYERLDKKEAGPKRRNEAPEKIVEKECMAWMRSQGWQVEIYEAKATYSPSQKRWRSSSMKKGTTDCMGVLPDGTALAVEFKAPKKLGSLRDDQRSFIEGRIKMNTFACVTDSVARLKEIFSKWNDLRYCTPIKAQEYLEGTLPKKRKSSKSEEDDDWFKNL
jgi:hypothetical protein